jgi:hypothetical protein
MNRIIGLLLLIGIFLSCKDTKVEQEVLSMEDFAGKTGGMKFEEEEVDSVPEIVISSKLGALIELEKEEFDTSFVQDFHPIDRFSYNEAIKIAFQNKQENTNERDNTSKPIATLFYYTFSDTTKTKNALYNWLDCFGEDCSIVKLNTEINKINSIPLFSLVYDTTIIVVNYDCKNKMQHARTFEQNIISQFGKNFTHQLSVGCGGPLKWK